jgi:hypothetical protein
MLSLKPTELFFKLFSRLIIKIFLEYSLIICQVPKQRTINIKNINNISNDLILDKIIY